jgi:V/A-type H+/Na+-transporting ATPase subunit K
MTLGLFLAVLGAALSIVGGGIGTIVGTNHVAGSGSGLVAHKPKLFGLVLLLSALPSSQGIYGFLGSILILQQTGLLGGTIQQFSVEQGLVLLAAALPVGLLGMFSGAGQGKVLQSGLQIIANNQSNVGQAVILGVLMESMAVFGLLLTILIVNSFAV